MIHNSTWLSIIRCSPGGASLCPCEILLDDPVTLWIVELRQADEAAARKLWNHFFNRMYELGRKKLLPETRRVYDEEDAAQSAFHSFCAGIVAGRFPDLHDRNGLWNLLLAITANKVANRQRDEHRQRRDARRNLSDAVFTLSSGDSVPAGIDVLASREPTPELVAEFVETCECLFQSLDDPALRQLVTLRMEGYTDDEIARRLTWSRRTVQRRLEIVRRHWNRLESPSG
jgi:DNA-directed RNA polymerase specialized sigma24 family protein